MSRARIDDLCSAVCAPRGAVPAAVRARLDSLTKPRGSLGRIEELALQIALVLGDPPPPLHPRTVLVLAGDHGVTARGVSAYPAEVTCQMCMNIATGGAAVAVLARTVQARVVVADLGVATPVVHPGVIDANVVRGTRDLSREAALLEHEVSAALSTGADLVAKHARTSRLVAVGEMGIGNTTAAAALAVLLTGCSVAEAVGRGTGVSDAALDRKRAAVELGVARVASGASVTQILAEVGGAEIAGMTGAVLAAAAAGQLIVLDGFISSVAGLAAAKMSPQVRQYLIASHRSSEPGHGHVLAELGLRPLLDLDLRLGEGSGAVLAIPLLDAAASVLREMATFESAGVTDIGTGAHR